METPLARPLKNARAALNKFGARQPWVLLYDAAVPREDAAMLNLETEADVTISRAIRPAMLPVPVYTYLSPRGRITCFFDDGLTQAGARE